MSFHSPPAVFVRHVQIKTTDLGRSLAFYRDILGFRLLEQDERTALLTADGKTSLVSLVQPDDVITKPPGTVGLYHLALLLPNRSDLAALVTHLSAQGVRFGASNHLVSEAIYFQDPDGIGIEVYTDTDPTTWK
ncbi:VOC family protein, partial [Candidatus Darwinibacter acetoxidans]